jgi:deoxycytidylate deaminase
MKDFVKRAAVKMAFQSTFPTFRHGAVIEIGGSIVAAGVNGYKPTIHRASKFSTHAEIACVSRVEPEKLDRARLYVARVNKAGQIVNSRPCARCELYLRSLGLGRVYYSIDGLFHWGELKL